MQKIWGGAAEKRCHTVDFLQEKPIIYLVKLYAGAERICKRES